MIDRRRADLKRHFDDLRKNDGWQPFQHFVLGLLHYKGYTDLRYSAPRSDFGRDAVGITPDGKRCVIAVSFECTKAKVLGDTGSVGLGANSPLPLKRSRSVRSCMCSSKPSSTNGLVMRYMIAG